MKRTIRAVVALLAVSSSMQALGMPREKIAVHRTGVDPAIVARASAEIAAGLRTPAVRQRLADIGVEAIGGTPAEMAVFLAAELARWGTVIRASGARLD